MKSKCTARDIQYAPFNGPQQKLTSVWWMQIHTIVDVKPEGPKIDKELEDTIIQLCAYIRQVFREQLDRRFVIALLLCDEELTLWFCDRVGLVRTVDPINIHDVSTWYRFGVLPFISITETRCLLKYSCCLNSSQTRMGSYNETIFEKWGRDSSRPTR